jgi:hypothetical protein
MWKVKKMAEILGWVEKQFLTSRIQKKKIFNSTFCIAKCTAKFLRKPFLETFQNGGTIQDGLFKLFTIKILAKIIEKRCLYSVNS